MDFAQDDPEYLAMLERQRRERLGETHGAPLAPGEIAPEARGIRSQLGQMPASPTAAPAPDLLDAALPRVSRDVVPATSWPVAPPPVVPAAAPPPALPVTVKTGGQTATTREKRDKSEIAAESAREVTAQVERKAVAAEGDVGVSAAKAKAKGSQREAAELQAHATRQAAVIAAGQEEIKQRTEQYDEERLKLREMAPTDYYAGRPGLRIVNALAMGMGELGAGLARTGHNTAADIIQQQIQQHYQSERDKIDSQRENVREAKEGIGIARQSHLDRLADLQTMDLARMSALKQAIAVKADQVGTEHAVAEKQRMIAKVDAVEAQRKLELAQTLRQKITSTTTYGVTEGAGAGAGGKPLPEAARKDAEAASQQAARMEQVAALIEQNPRAWAEYQDALRSEKKADAGLGKHRGVLQGMGFSPVAFEERLKSQGSREIHSAMAPMIAAKARELDPVGVLNEGSLTAGRSHLNMMARSPKEMATEARAMAARYRATAQAAAGGAYQAPSAAAAKPQDPGKMMRLKDGRVVRVFADGTYEPAAGG